METSNYDVHMPDKKKFLLDMLTLTERENFEIGDALKAQSEALKDLADIVREIGHIKQNTRGDIYKLAEKKDISMNINKRPRDFDTLYWGQE